MVFDRLKRKPQTASVQPQPQFIPYGQQVQGQPQQQQQPQPQSQPAPQSPPPLAPGWVYDNYGRAIPDPRYAQQYPQAQAPMQLEQPPIQAQAAPQFNPAYQNQSPMRPAARELGKKKAVILPMVIAFMMIGGVMGCAYFSFLMTPFVSTTVIRYIPALIGLLFLMNGVGIIAVLAKAGK